MQQQTTAADPIRKKIVGTFIQKRRERAEKTQWEVAHAMGYTTAQFVSNWERGVSLPPMDALPKLAQYLDIPAKDFQDTMLKYEEEMLKQHKRLLRALFRGMK